MLIMKKMTTENLVQHEFLNSLCIYLTHDSNKLLFQGGATERKFSSLAPRLNQDGSLILCLGLYLILNLRRMAENGFAPAPLRNFADISYLVEN